MYLLVLWFTFYGNNVSPSISVVFDNKDQCIQALESLQRADNNIVIVQGTCIRK